MKYSVYYALSQYCIQSLAARQHEHYDYGYFGAPGTLKYRCEDRKKVGELRGDIDAIR
jgi:hypothetical protein